MPSFDIVSELDHHEIANAVDQANREVSTRFDFKGTGAKFEVDEKAIQLEAQVDFQLKQMYDVLLQKFAKRKLDPRSVDAQEPVVTGSQAKQTLLLVAGIDQPLAKRIIRMVKESKLKVQTSIQGDKLRVSGKKRDDLQAAIALVKDAEIKIPLQYVNFRD